MRIEKSLNFDKVFPKTLLDDFIDNRVVPLVGAGFSKNALIPSGLEIPDWDKLGKAVANYLPNYEYTSGNAIDALSVFEELNSRAQLIELIARELHIDLLKPSETHDAFCDLFFNTICTTNFDFLLEDAMKKTDRPVTIVNSEQNLGINLSNRSTLLIKIHGDFQNANDMIVTENDYDTYIDSYKVFTTFISSLFISNTVLLIGYSFDDYDIRSIWSIINNRLGKLKRKAYCLMVDANESEIVKFRRRNIDVINIPGKKKDYPSLLCEAFRWLKKYIDDSRVKIINTSDVRVNQSLKLVPSGDGRMCYLAAPFGMAGELSSVFKAALKKYNLTFTTAGGQGSEINGILSDAEFYISTSSVVIADVSYDSDIVRWEISVARKKNKTILIIANKNFRSVRTWDNEIENRIIYYDSIYDEHFLDVVQSFISSSFSSENDLNEAKRLFNNEEYTAAALLAFRFLDYSVSEKSKSGYGFWKTLIDYQKSGKIRSVTISQIRENSFLRNRLVHQNYTLTKKRAESVLEFVEACIQDLISIE